MAVIECRSCSTKVNEGAAACPECGADPRTGASLIDWSRLAPTHPDATLAEARAARENVLPIGLCIAGGVWAILVWAAGSLVSAIIGLEGADPDPPRHVGLLVVVLGFVVAAAVAFWAAARMPSQPRSAKRLALVAFGLGYAPPLLMAVAWDLIERGHVARDVVPLLLGVAWTLGGWTLLLAALTVRQVAPGRAPGTLAHTTATTTSRGDTVHDDHEHDHQTPGSDLEPAVDARSGQLERHCSQCGALIEGSHEFCQVCALEASGGELPPEEDAG
jgi:RNA polymerase subunit RPABC4/transcription elongation factor Spt4